MARMPKIGPTSTAKMKVVPVSKAAAPAPKAALPRPAPKLRTLWTGTLKLALVTLPVAIVSATETVSRFTFHQVHEPSGHRVKQEKIVPGVDGVIDTGDIRKGYEVEKGLQFLSVARATASDELALAEACQEKLAEMVPAVELYREPQLARAGPYRQPLRVPMRKPHPGLAGVDEALADQRAAFASALGAAKYYRKSNLPMRQSLYEQQVVAMKYNRIEIARLMRIRHELSRAID
jgi:hypothetical protein